MERRGWPTWPALVCCANNLLGLVLVLLGAMAPASASAWTLYVEPKWIGYASLSTGVIYTDTPEQANDAAYAEWQAAIPNACPNTDVPVEKGPILLSMNSPSSNLLNGKYTQWGIRRVLKLYRSPTFCEEFDDGWATYARTTFACPNGIVPGIKWTGDRVGIVYCAIQYPDARPCPTCSTPNPVLITRGEKILPETDYAGVGGLEFRRLFRGASGRFISEQFQPLFDHSVPAAGPSPGCFPGVYERPQSTGGTVPTEYCFPYVSIEQAEYGYLDASGDYVKFTGPPGSPVAPLDVADRLMAVTDAQGVQTWRVKRKNNTLYIYNAGRQLQQIVRHDGRAWTFSYVSGVLVSQTDAFGRSLQWEFSSASRKLLRMTDPAGGHYDYVHDADLNLVSVTYPADSSGGRVTRRYHYDMVLTGQGSQKVARLTGVTDEIGHRLSTFTYDGQGRAVSTRLHAGTTDVNQYSISYNGSPVVTDPLGTSRTYAYATVLGQDAITSVSQPTGSGSAAASRAATYDAQRNLTSQDDYNGKRTCYANDVTRNLETVRIEGLTASNACSNVTPANAVLPAGSRKVSTQWHPHWRLETKVAEPGRITTTVYNGQPDPFNGNSLATCAPADALLPDGTPIAVVCKRVEQATSDSSGGAGFGASLQAGVVGRTTRWTYNGHGHVLTEDGPRTDINDVTTYAYHAETTADHLPGDLATMTDPAGRVTQYARYNRHGQLLERIDPNGVVTLWTYDARMRLASTTVAGATTGYEYDAAGQLKRITLPDSSWIGYDYDGAHRQTAVYDHRGNRIDYVLDNAGNRTGENTKDPSGALKRQLARSIDALGRVQQTTGRE